MQKYDLAVLNRVEHFLSPQPVEKLVQFCGEFSNEKKKKRSKAVRRQAKIGPGYLSNPAQNSVSLQNFIMTTTRSLKIDCVFLLFRLLKKPCIALIGVRKGVRGVRGV